MKLLAVVLAVVVLSSFALAAPTQDTLNNFAQWVQTHKLQTKCNLGRFDGEGFGAVARTEIKEGEPIVAIPTGVIISNNRIKSESALKDFQKWTNAFAFEPGMVWLLMEKNNPSSNWKPYIDILPESYPTHPLSWTDAELDEAKGTALPDTTRAIKEFLRRSYDNLVENLFKENEQIFPLNVYTFESFVWAFQTWNSRSWSLTRAEEPDIALVPLADMFNHRPGAGLGSLNEEGTAFIINATSNYAAGEQVFDNYGPKSNYELLSTYGFVLESNPDDSMILHFNLKPSNLVHSIIEPILKAVDPNYKQIRIRPNKVPVELLRVFRLSVMEFGELEQITQALQGKGVSLKNELRAFRAAIKALSGMLQSFETTIKEDLQLLSEENLSINQRNAIVLRKNQKEILTNVILVLGKMWENILLSGQLLGEIEI